VFNGTTPQQMTGLDGGGQKAKLTESWQTDEGCT
jgi:hypothetical protein